MTSPLHELSAWRAQMRGWVAAVQNRRRGNPPDQHERRRRTFQQIYNRSVWGKNGAMPYFSSVGWNADVDELYIDRMVDMLLHHSVELGRPLTLVDVGCGDFRIGRELLLRLPDLTYIGCDIVPELVARHTANYGTDRVSFKTLDVVCNLLPEGDVCLVRQLFQHLSNADISEAVKHLNCPIVYVTEWHPAHKRGAANPDKVLGSGLRFDWPTGQGRGVELSQAPFHLPAQESFHIAVPPNHVLVTDRLPLARGVIRKALPSSASASAAG